MIPSLGRRIARALVVTCLVGSALAGCPAKTREEPAAPADAGAVLASASAAPSAPGATIPATATAPGPSPCPPEMALIDGRFCVDRWEGSVLDPDGSDHPPYKAVGPRKVRAVSRAGALPQAYISAEEADAACKRSGKHLCTTQQWQDACMGTTRPYRVYPYGNELDRSACNTTRPLHPSIRVFGKERRDSESMNDPRLYQAKETVSRTGEFSRCVTPEGVFDMQGNLLEWTEGPEKALLMGGHFVDAVKHGKGCRYVTAGHGADYHDYTTGFRCCKKADRAALAEAESTRSDADAGAPDAATASGDASSPVVAEGVRDPPGMRSFADALGKLPTPIPPPYEQKDAACPVDMILIDGERCPVPIERCKTWLPRLSVGEKIACAEFEEPSECTAPRQKLRYCIDRYEYQPPGYGVPLTHVNYLEAQNLCAEMNKRLCMETEWEFACEGPDALPYPYGYVRDAKRCNHDFPEEELVTGPEQFIDHRVARDALPECKSPFGVMNMVGNVDEWTTRDGAEKGHRAILRGGWWLIGRNRCRAATANHGERYAGVQTGLRCCKAAR